MTQTGATYQRVIDHFTELVDSIAPNQWDAPTPCEAWTVRDLIEHVVVRDRRLATLFGAGSGPESLAPEADLPAQWHERVTWWGDRLADPQQRDALWPTPFGELSFQDAAYMLMTGELTIHTWDLARGLGVDDMLDPEAVHASFITMRQFGDAARSPETLGPEVPAPAGSDEQTQLLAFSGRTA